MADFYGDMQATATELLTEFSQGVINYAPKVAGANEWDGDTYGTPIVLKATARGVSARYATDLIKSSDIMITAAVFSVEPDMQGKITIDGKPRQIVQITRIPEAGTALAWRIFVRG